jgi:ABC-2 type transport system ATP-binding protein
LQALAAEGLSVRDIETSQSSLEEIVVGRVKEDAA